MTGFVLDAVLLESVAMSFVLPVSECDMQLSTREKGILSGAVYIGIICSSLVWGYLADTLGRKRVMQPTLFLSGLTTQLSIFVTDFHAFTVLRFLNGVLYVVKIRLKMISDGINYIYRSNSLSGSSATIYAYLGEFHCARYRSKVMMYSSVLFSIGCMLLPIIAWATINNSVSFELPIIGIEIKPWRQFLIVCAMPSLLCSISFFFLPESPKFVLASGDQAGALQILERINRWNNGKHASPLNIKELYEEAGTITNRQQLTSDNKSNCCIIQSIWTQIKPLFMGQHLETTFVASTMQFCIFFTASGLYMWFPDIVNRVTTSRYEQPDERIGICEIINRSQVDFTSERNSSIESVCSIQTFNYCKKDFTMLKTRPKI